MSLRVTVEFNTAEAADRFREYVRSGYDVMAVKGLAQILAQTPTENVAMVVDESVPADAMRANIKIRIGTSEFDIQRTEYKEEFLAADVEKQIDMITVAVRELIYKNHGRWVDAT